MTAPSFDTTAPHLGTAQSAPLIAGAGPTGLAAALFLARQGIFARIVDPRPERSQRSKALAVNPRTLDLLEPTGVTARMLELGMPLHGLTLHGDRRVLRTVSFERVHPRYPFMLALSQAATESLLEEALAAAGGCVERGVRLVDCATTPDGVRAALAPARGGARRELRVPWLLAADGAHSTARRCLAISFRGAGFPHPWHLADVPLDTDLAEQRAHVFLGPGRRLLFMVRAVEPGRDRPTRAPLWRLVSSEPDPVAHLPRGRACGPPVWSSRFPVAHRMAGTMSAGEVHLAGDAAHLHSPIGARGMNLGIEDAWVFARLAIPGRLDRYGRLRRRVDRRVVRTVDLFSHVAACEPALLAPVRRMLPLALGLPSLRRRMIATVTGLDHPLPAD